MAIDYEKEGKIAIFTINRPEALNSINVLAIKELHEAMVSFRDDPDYKLSTRLRGEDLDTKGKKGVVITYETLTSKKILSI